MGGFPKLGGTLFGGPHSKGLVFWGLYWGPLFWETTIQADKNIPPTTNSDKGGW